MKKATIIVITALFAVVFQSCSKDPSVIVGNSGTNITTRPPQVNAVSQWFQMSFASQTNGTENWLQGTAMLTSVVSYDVNTHKKLAFARLLGREGYVYKALPANYHSTEGTLELRFRLTFQDFTIFIKNVDAPSRLASAPALNDFRYRFVIVSDNIYRQHNIDWTDYEAVRNALLSSGIAFPD